MIRRLRLKFMILLMGTVFLIMTVIFAALCVRDWHEGYEEARSVLQVAIADARNPLAGRDWENHPPRLGAWHDRDFSAERDELDDEGFESADHDDARKGANGRAVDAADAGGDADGSDDDADGSDVDRKDDAGSPVPGAMGFDRVPQYPVALYYLIDGALVEAPRSLAVLSDDDLTPIARNVATASAGMGTLPAYGLYFFKEGSASDSLVAFVDTAQFDTWQELALVLAAVEAATLAVAFLVGRRFARWALAPVERAWEQQNRFVADASHDLKTPLTVILANTSILLDEPDLDAAERRKWLMSTKEEATGMRVMVDDLLDSARAGDDAPGTAGAAGAASAVGNAGVAGTADADHAADVADAAGAGDGAAAAAGQVSWSRLVEKEALQFEGVALEKEVALTVTVQEGLFVASPEEDLRRLADILLDNACKYADSGGFIDVSLDASDTGKGRLRVANSGDPIPEADLPYIFDRFYRVDSARTSREGHGLGLSIAKGIVERLGGSIVAQSTRERTEFTVTLPLAEDQ